ncbi:MAG: hypothetical protein K2X01_00345 [Cyanobacteria bacterium]|nr:hypothetical protein [Cyanobacteriota bacterium]
MTLVNTALAQADSIDLLLSELIDKFPTLTLEQRLVRSTLVFTQLNTFFRNQASIVQHVLVEHPLYKTRYHKFELTHDAMVVLYENIIMLHVEEKRYREELIKLRDKFKAYIEQPYESFMCQIQAGLSESDEKQILEEVLKLP